MTAPGRRQQPLSRPAAPFDAPAVSVRSVWAGPSRAWCVDAYRRPRNGGAEETDSYSQNPPNEQSRVGRSPSRRRIMCRTKVPVMKATTHSEPPPPQSLWPRQLFAVMTIGSCSHVDTHH